MIRGLPHGYGIMTGTPMSQPKPLGDPVFWWDWRDWDGNGKPTWPTPSATNRSYAGRVPNLGTAGSAYDMVVDFARTSNPSSYRQSIACIIQWDPFPNPAIGYERVMPASFWDDMGGLPCAGGPMCVVLVFGPDYQQGFGESDFNLAKFGGWSHKIFTTSYGSIYQDLYTPTPYAYSYQTSDHSSWDSFDPNEQDLPSTMAVGWFDANNAVGDIYYGLTSLRRDITAGGRLSGNTFGDLFYKHDYPGDLASHDPAAYDAIHAADINFGFVYFEVSWFQVEASPGLIWDPVPGDGRGSIRGMALFRGAPTTADLRAIASDFGVSV